MIPKVFHWVWIGGKPPDWALANMVRFELLNPDFQFVMHGEDSLLPQFRTAYNRITGQHALARKSDLIRLSVLVIEGGWYFDCDFLAIRPLSQLYEYYNGFPKGCFITHGAYNRGRPWIANGIIGAEPGCRFLTRAVRWVESHGRNQPLRWGTFGPELFTSLAEQHPKNVHVGLLDDFYRLQDREDSMAAYARIRAAGYKREAIEEELGQPLPFAMHMSMQDETKL